MHPWELKDLDPFDLLDAEAERLDRHFSALDAVSWTQPSRCAGWSVRDVLAHLAGEELYNHACLDGDFDSFQAMLGCEGVGSITDFNEWCVRLRADLPVEGVVREWRTASTDTRRRMRALGQDAMLPTLAGRYPVGLQTFRYASECATHSDDVGAPVGVGEEAMRTDWRARVGQLVMSEQSSPATVRSEGGGYRVSVGEETALLSAGDFVAATVARLPGAHPLSPRLREALRSLA